MGVMPDLDKIEDSGSYLGLALPSTLMKGCVLRRCASPHPCQSNHATRKIQKIRSIWLSHHGHMMIVDPEHLPLRKPLFNPMLSAKGHACVMSRISSILFSIVGVRIGTLLTEAAPERPWRNSGSRVEGSRHIVRERSRRWRETGLPLGGLLQNPLWRSFLSHIPKSTKVESATYDCADDQCRANEVFFNNFLEGISLQIE